MKLYCAKCGKEIFDYTRRLKTPLCNDCRKERGRNNMRSYRERKLSGEIPDCKKSVEILKKLYADINTQEKFIQAMANGGISGLARKYKLSEYRIRTLKSDLFSGMTEKEIAKAFEQYTPAKKRALSDEEFTRRLNEAREHNGTSKCRVYKITDMEAYLKSDRTGYENLKFDRIEESRDITAQEILHMKAGAS